MAGLYALEATVISIVAFTMLMAGVIPDFGAAQLMKDGNEALKDRKYDVAIAKYDQGIKEEPEYVGIAPGLYCNRGMARMQRAADLYNKAIKATDENEKINGLKNCSNDLAASANDFVASWKLLKNTPASEIDDQSYYDTAKVQTVRGAKDTFQMAVRTGQVPQPVIDAAILLLPEYLAVESDTAKRSEAALLIADLYRAKTDSFHAADAYKKILESSPDNVDALAGAGLSLVNAGYQSSDDAKLQEGANYLKQYLQLAPDTHKFKPDAITALETLNKQNKDRVKKHPY